jgi:hypothetical protein
MDGITCNNQVEIRRIAIHNARPSNLFNLMELKVLKVDEDKLATMTADEITAYYNNETAYSVVPFKPKQDPNNAWAVPFVTNHKYKLHWRHGLDFTQM